MTALPCEHCAQMPTYKHVEAQEQPYRGLWQAIVAHVAGMSPDMPIYQRDLDRIIVALWDEQPDAKAAFALRTTRYGREGEAE